MENRVLVSVQEQCPVPLLFDPEKIESYILAVLARLGYDGEEISILFCTDEMIRDLNKTYRGIDSPTDVLSFENGTEYEENGKVWLEAGDIAISLETLPKNADFFKVPQNEELKRLLIHGVLHLNGYDHGEAHIEPEKEILDEMLKLQESILAEFSSVVLIA